MVLATKLDHTCPITLSRWLARAAAAHAPLVVALLIALLGVTEMTPCRSTDDVHESLELQELGVLGGFLHESLCQPRSSARPQLYAEQVVPPGPYCRGP